MLGLKRYVDEACWKGYKKKGMKKMFGKMYPNCVKEEGDPISQALKSDKDLADQSFIRKIRRH